MKDAKGQDVKLMADQVCWKLEIPRPDTRRADEVQKIDWVKDQSLSRCLKTSWDLMSFLQWWHLLDSFTKSLDRLKFRTVTLKNK